MISGQNLPTGLISFVFTDIEGYSTLEKKFKAALQPVLDLHNQLIREAVAAHKGIEIRVVGDAFFLSFLHASDAVRFALSIQLDILQHTWNLTDAGQEIPIQLRVRLGVHTGEARTLIHPTGQFDYFGTAVNCAARASSAGHGGQILITEATRLLAQQELSDNIHFRDLGIHRLKGSGEERLWQVCHEGLSLEFPPLSTLDPQKHNLPVPLTPFLGREKQLAEWARLIQQSTTRLVTIAGFGGVGKTRTALQLAELCSNDFKDGVWWVPLENTTTGDEMIQRIAEQLVKNLKPHPTVREQVWNFHRDRELLLVLDNVEQIAGNEAAQAVIGLLNAAPGVKILVTSRRSLEVAPERLVELEPFCIKEAEALFVERARARKATFTLNEQNAPDVKAICCKLEGVPLAIEIAATRIVLMAPHQILQRLNDQLRLLVARDPSSPARHQALRAAVEWSYNLLSEDAKNVLRQLSVFAGGFTLEAAESVVCREVGEVVTNQRIDVLDQLMELRNQSLLRSRTELTTQEERLLMLQVVREFAAERLALEGIVDKRVHRWHAEHFCHWVHEQSEALRTENEALALTSIEREFDNLRSALSWTERNDHELCAQLAVVFHQPLYLRGLWEESNLCLATGWIAAQSLQDSAPTFTLRAALRYHQSSLLHDLGHIAEARVLAEESLAIFRDLQDATGTANTLNFLALLATEDGDITSAEQLCEEAMTLWPVDNYVGRAKTQHNRARLAAIGNRPSVAQQLYEETLQLRQHLGDVRGQAVTLGNLGTLAQVAGENDTARKMYEESLQLRRSLQDPFGTAVILNNLADLDILEGNYARAVVLFTHAERIFSDLSSPYIVEPVKALSTLKERLGDEVYSPLRRQAEQAAWEDIV